MKVSVVENKKFVPIKLSLTIETPEELCDLWLRMNLSGISVDKENGCYLKYCATQAENEKINGFQFWNILDGLVDDKQLRHGEV